MYTFGQKENVGSLLEEFKLLERAITCELNAQDAEASRIAAEIQMEIGASPKEPARHDDITTVKHTEQERRVVATREEGRGRLEELRRKLANARHELTVIHSPILIFPHEVTSEIFNWHMLMGGRLAALLLVCTRWTAVAYSSPQIWSRIAVTGRNRGWIHLQGAVICDRVDYLRSVLSRSLASPLQVEIVFKDYSTSVDDTSPSQPSSLHYWPQAGANRDEAISLILDNEVFIRCTYFILGDYFTHLECNEWPKRVKNMTILPLLSSLDIHTSLDDIGLHFVRSLIQVSPSLRHIRASKVSPEDLGAGMWTKRIESYGWLYDDKPCHLLHESPSLRELGIVFRPAVALTLPGLQVLRWNVYSYSVLPLITAPHLHTLILAYGECNERLSASSITLPNLRVAIHTNISDLATIHIFQTPALEHLSIRSEAPAPTALFTLFDGSAHMPTPKSLHLECAFTDEALLVMLVRLPLLEELQIGGALIKDVFWEGFTTSDKPERHVCLPPSHRFERPKPIFALDRTLAPNLKILLINYSTNNMYLSPPRQMSKGRRWTREGLALVSREYWGQDNPSYGEEFTVTQASAAVAVREQAGCPLEIVACFFPEQTVEVLIGNLDTLPQRPKWVVFAAIWCN